MPESGILKGCIIFIENNHQVKVGKGSVVYSDQVNFAESKISVSTRSLSNQELVMSVIAW